MKSFVPFLILSSFILLFSCNQNSEPDQFISTHDREENSAIKADNTAPDFSPRDFEETPEVDLRERDLADASLGMPPVIKSEPSAINPFAVDLASEILEKRDRTTKHYLRKDGKTIDAILSPKSVHFKNDNNQWEDINTKIVPSESNSYAYTNQKNNIKSWFPADISREGVKIVTEEGKLQMGENLRMSWSGIGGEFIKSENFKSSDLQVDENKIVYKNVLPYVHNEYIVEADKLKHNIILEEKPFIPEDAEYLLFSEEVVLPDNWTIDFDQELKGLVILKGNKEIYLEVPFPDIYEANNRAVTTDETNSGFDLVQLSSNKYQINTKISQEWLQERNYPLIVDPTLVLNGASSGYMRQKYTYNYVERESSYCGWNYSNNNSSFYAYNNTSARIANYSSTRTEERSFDCQYGWLGKKYYKTTYTTVSNYYRGWIKYNTSTIPDTGIINSVEFSANVSGGYMGELRTTFYASGVAGPYSNTRESYNSISSGGYLGYTNYSDAGQYSYIVLDARANSEVQELLPSNYFQIGLYGSYHNANSQFKLFDTNASLLRITYQECVPPVAAGKNISVQLDAEGSATITAEDIDDGSTADCGLESMMLSKTSFTCVDLGDNSVTLTVTDVNGATSSYDLVVTVEDNIAPTAIAQDITVQLDASGAATITPADIDNGSNDACGIADLALDVTSFDCSNVGTNTVILTVTDNNNNVSTATAIVTVEDNVAPAAIAQDITVQLDASGAATITAADIDKGSNDACGIADLALDVNSFDCTNIGANTVILNVTDNNNNVSTATAIVTVEDNVAPVPIAQDITVQLDASGAATITAEDIDNGSNDACDIASLALSKTDFDCSNIGSNLVTLTVTDNNGNVSTVDANVEVKDEIEPVAIAQDITVQLDASGTVTITPADIDNGSHDACGIADLALDVSSFDCTNIGANTVILTVTDNNNNVSTATAIVTVEDNVAPAAIAQDITVQLDASGVATITAEDIDNGSDDACGIADLALDVSSFDCTNIGANTITLSVTDNNNNVSTATATVTVEDNVAPAAIAQDITVQLNASGAATITAEDIDNGSHDACGIADLALSKTDFDCSNIGSNLVTLTVTDNNGIVSTVDANVEVKDEVDPVAIAQDITVQLDASGASTITAADIDNGSDDACEIADLALDVTSFDCTNIGANTVTLTVTDNNNNISTATATVTVEDNVAPAAIAQDITVQLNASGAATITAEDIDNGSNDACDIASLALSKTDFDCSNIGPNSVTLTVTDENGNVSTVDANVEVKDEVNPVAIAQDVIVQLDASGNGSTTAQLVDNGSNDACGIASLALSKTDFDCSNIGSNLVTLTVTDNNGNVSTVDANVEVKDEIEPVAIAQDITVQLDASGAATFTPADMDKGSNDACGIADLTLDVTSFDCTNIGANTVTLSVTDSNNNVSTATATVTVEDNVDPVAIAQDITVELDASGAATITPEDIDNGSDDACGITSLALDVTSFDCTNIGANTITLSVTDNNNNVSTATATVTVEDNVAPAAIAQDITVQLDASGAATITPADIDNGSDDACGIANLALDVISFDCSNVGANTVTLSVTDHNNNVSTATAIVTVEDNVGPTAIAQDITVELDASGAATITAADIDKGSNDACGIASLALSKTDFDCSNIGPNLVTLTVTDNNGNVSTVDANVEVKDEIDPVAIAQDITVQLDASGAATITAADIDNGSDDACGISSLALDVSSFDCSNVGANTVTLSVTDNNNNISTATATVTVEDNVDPVAIARDITVQLDASGAATITPADIDNGSDDACGIAALALDVTSFDCSNVGANTVTLSVTDNNNNVSTATATVTVEDNVAPEAIAQDITVQLDASGAATITPADIDNGSYDACGIADLTLDVTSFDCTNIGPNTVTLSVTDNNNNISTATATVTVEDNVAPVAIARDITVQLDASGAATITPEDIDNGSNDACGIADLALSKTDFDCSNIGSNSVTLTVTDENGNVYKVDANVEVKDEVDPVAIAQDITVQLDASGAATITAEDIDNGSNDACDIRSLALSKTDFDCTNIGANTVTLTVTDNNNNISTATATVTVEDNVAPAAIAQDITVQLNASGAATITAEDIDNGSNDACGIASLALSQTDFDCSNVGPNSVTLTVTDKNGNVSTVDANVEVKDEVKPDITCVSSQERYVDPYQTYYTVQGSEFDATATDACGVASLTYSGGIATTSGNSMNEVKLELGVNTMTWTAVDINNYSSECSTTVTIKKRPTTLTYTGDESEQYSDQANLSATLIDKVSGTGIAGKTIKFTIGSQATSAVTDANGVASTNLILTQDPANTYMVETEFQEDAGYLGSTDSHTFDLTQENAMIAYTGQSLQATPSTRDPEAIVVLSANIQDITASPSYPLYDAFEGDIRNAKVNFMIVETGETSGWLPVTDLVDPFDSKTGRVSYEWLAQLSGNNTSESFTIRVMVDNGYYTAEDETVVTVYIPTGDFITGGGYLLPDNSAGQYASTPGLKNNFGFNVKYNKKGTKLKGHMNVIFRRLESDGIVHKYQIKSNAVQSLGVDVSDPDAQIATFITKSNLTDITNPENEISLGGNLILKVNMTDRGEPGTDDSISFDLTDGNSGVLLYSGNWTGIASEEMNLEGGNLLVHSGFSLEGSSEELETSSTETESIPSLDFTVSPNPSTDYFTVHILTENKRDKIQLSVHDYSGSVVYQTTGKANDTYTFGHNFQAGTYIVRVEQAGEVQQKIIIRDN